MQDTPPLGEPKEDRRARASLPRLALTQDTYIRGSS